jgi:hypothetical protein
MDVYPLQCAIHSLDEGEAQAFGRQCAIVAHEMAGNAHYKQAAVLHSLATALLDHADGQRYLLALLDDELEDDGNLGELVDGHRPHPPIAAVAEGQGAPPVGIRWWARALARYWGMPRILRH